MTSMCVRCVWLYMQSDRLWIEKGFYKLAALFKYACMYVLYEGERSGAVTPPLLPFNLWLKQVSLSAFKFFFILVTYISLLSFKMVNILYNRLESKTRSAYCLFYLPASAPKTEKILKFFSLLYVCCILHHRFWAHSKLNTINLACVFSNTMSFNSPGFYLASSFMQSAMVEENTFCCPLWTWWDRYLWFF